MYSIEGRAISILWDAESTAQALTHISKNNYSYIYYMAPLVERILVGNHVFNTDFLLMSKNFMYFFL